MLELLRDTQDIELDHRPVLVAGESAVTHSNFVIDKTLIFVTVDPGLLFIREYKAMIAHGYRIVIITPSEKVFTVQAYCEEEKVNERIDIFSVEEFLVINLYRLSGFSSQRRAVTIEQLITRYNTIIEACETDQSLKIAFG